MSTRLSGSFRRYLVGIARKVDINEARKILEEYSGKRYDNLNELVPAEMIGADELLRLNLKSSMVPPVPG